MKTKYKKWCTELVLGSWVCVWHSTKYTVSKTMGTRNQRIIHV